MLLTHFHVPAANGKRKDFTRSKHERGGGLRGGRASVQVSGCRAKSARRVLNLEMVWQSRPISSVCVAVSLG